MTRFATLILALIAAMPARAVDVLSCLEDGQTLEFTGQIIQETFPDHSPWVLLTDEAYCRAEYDMEIGDFKVTSTNVMRFQLIMDESSPAPTSADSSGTAQVVGEVYQASDPSHKTPLVIQVKSYSVN